MIRRPPRSTQGRSSAASDVYKRQADEVRAILEDRLNGLGNKKGQHDKPLMIRTAAVSEADQAAKKSSALEAFDLSMRLGKTLVLDHMDLRVPEGAVYALLGRNG